VSTLRFRTTLRRTDPRLGLFFYVPAGVIAPWGLTGTTTIEGTINGHPLGRRAVKSCGRKNPDWYVELTKPITAAIAGEEGDEVEVELRLADMTMPDEMVARMKNDAEFTRAYEALIPNHKRNAIELYLSAKTPAGRTAKLDKIDREIKAMLARRERPAGRS